MKCQKLLFIPPLIHPVWTFPRRQKRNLIFAIGSNYKHFFPWIFYVLLEIMFIADSKLPFFKYSFSESVSLWYNYLKIYNQKCISDAKFRNNCNLNLAAWFLCPASLSPILCLMICREGSTSGKMSSCKQRSDVERNQKLFHPSTKSCYNLFFQDSGQTESRCHQEGKSREPNPLGEVHYWIILLPPKNLSLISALNSSALSSNHWALFSFCLLD